jgi:4-amino-4-deoxy-L-arabinose transferase-like glycosyltransferase
MRWFLIVVTLVRLVVAAEMPLSADEAYYRVWAHALAPGYLDHPPMVALWIRAGTALIGDTNLGIRLFGPLSALLGSLLLWRAGEDLAPGRGTGRRAVWLLNGTLLLNVGSVVMTPDTPLLLFWTASIAALARLLRTGKGAWWIAAGAAAGAAFDSKYTAILLVPGVVAWLLAVASMRFWLRRREFWAAALVAVALATPVLLWNAEHDWASFARQGGRAGDWHPSAAIRFFAELLLGQIGLATPVLAVLFVVGIWRCVRAGVWRTPAAGLITATTLVPLAVFLQHALGDRVQANWPAILFPGAALAAAMTVQRFCRSGVALGLGLSALVYLQATTALLDLPRRLDFSLIRLAGWGDLALAVEAARIAAGADCVAADEYGLAVELAYRLPGPVLGAEPRWALFGLPPAPASCISVLLVRSARRGALAPSGLWPELTPAGEVARARGGIVAETYRLYRAPVPPGAVLLPARG